MVWRVADALALPFADSAFDAVLCQFGVMFFQNKIAGYREAFRVLKPGGRLQIADIVVHKDIPVDGREDVASWTA